MIEVKNIYCGYDNKKIIKDLSFNVNNGENLCIVGPNGCGKSTLLKSIANIIEYEGSVKIDNKEVSSFSRIDLAKKVALMSQTSQIYFPYTVYDTVSLGRYAYSKGVFSKLSLTDKRIIVDSMKKVGIYELKDKLITELSGGQLQRVFLAKIFAQDPDIILLDEPTSALDPELIEDVLNVIKKLAKEGTTMIVVTHEMNFAREIATKVILLADGKIVEENKPEEFFTNPKDERTRKFLKIN